MKTKALISFAVTAKLICFFVFAYAKSRFSHAAALMIIFFSFKEPNESNCLHVQVQDNTDSDLYSKFEIACKFIGKLQLGCAKAIVFLFFVLQIFFAIS